MVMKRQGMQGNGAAGTSRAKRDLRNEAEQSGLGTAIVTSALWAATHTQYPLSLQLTIFVLGMALAWLAQRARSLRAPYGAHMIMDVVLDSLVG